MTESVATISANIFNTEKTDYDTPSLFMGQQMGLLDTINRPFPQIFMLYKKMKKLDWDEQEFNFTSCNAEFKSCPKATSDMMIRSLAWQWEQDTVAARSLMSIAAPFISSTELFSAWGRVADNEVVHALTYSEIVKNSFDNPEEVLADVLKIKESLTRMESIAEVFEKAYQTSHKLSLGLVEKNQETYNDVFMFVVALYLMERLQFMASFSITFAIVNTGIFNPIGAAVQKICQDELEVHSELDKAILDIEMRTGMGVTAFVQNRAKIEQLILDVIKSEFTWVEYLFSEGRELTGVTQEQIKKWVLWNAKTIYDFFRIKPPMEMPVKNPLPFMDDWIDMSKMQRSPQEEKSGGYLLGGVFSDDAEVVYDVDF